MTIKLEPIALVQESLICDSIGNFAKEPMNSRFRVTAFGALFEVISEYQLDQSDPQQPGLSENDTSLCVSVIPVDQQFMHEDIKAIMHKAATDFSEMYSGEKVFEIDISSVRYAQLVLDNIRERTNERATDWISKKLGVEFLCIDYT